jgi:hypothetical protein
MDPIAGITLMVVTFFKGVVFAILIGNFFYQGFLLIVAQDDATRERARKLMLWGLIGATVVILANAAVEAFTYQDIGVISIELTGILNFLATIFGFLSVIAIIVAGIMIMISVEDSSKERGKKILLAAFVSLVVVVCSAAIVNTFLI